MNKVKYIFAAAFTSLGISVLYKTQERKDKDYNRVGDFYTLHPEYHSNCTKFAQTYSTWSVSRIFRENCAFLYNRLVYPSNIRKLLSEFFKTNLVEYLLLAHEKSEGGIKGGIELQLGEYYRKIDPTTALQWYTLGLQTLQAHWTKPTSENLETIVAVRVKMAKTLAILNDYEGADLNWTKALECAMSGNLGIPVIEAVFEECACWYDSRNNLIAGQIREKLLSILPLKYQKANLFCRVSLLYNNLANNILITNPTSLNEAKQRLEHAMHLINNATKVSYLNYSTRECIECQEARMVVHANLGLIAEQQENIELALEYYKIALINARRLKQFNTKRLLEDCVSRIQSNIPS